MPDASSRPVLLPAIVRVGVALPSAPAANTVTLPPLGGVRGGLVTYRFPAASRAMPVALLSTVLAPAIVRIGATSPLAPAAYTTTPGARPKVATASAWLSLSGLAGPSLHEQTARRGARCSQRTATRGGASR